MAKLCMSEIRENILTILPACNKFSGPFMTLKTVWIQMRSHKIWCLILDPNWPTGCISTSDQDRISINI